MNKLIFRIGDIVKTRGGKLLKIDRIAAPSVTYPLYISGYDEPIDVISLTAEGKMWTLDSDYDEGDYDKDIVDILTREEFPEYYL